MIKILFCEGTSFFLIIKEENLLFFSVLNNTHYFCNLFVINAYFCKKNANNCEKTDLHILYPACCRVGWQSGKEDTAIRCLHQQIQRYCRVENAGIWYSCKYHFGARYLTAVLNNKKFRFLFGTFFVGLKLISWLMYKFFICFWISRSM